MTDRERLGDVAALREAGNVGATARERLGRVAGELLIVYGPGGFGDGLVPGSRWRRAEPLATQLGSCRCQDQIASRARSAAAAARRRSSAAKLYPAILQR